MASYAFNDYALKNGLSNTTCNFDNSATIITLTKQYLCIRCIFRIPTGNHLRHPLLLSGAERASRDNYEFAQERSSTSLSGSSSSTKMRFLFGLI
uniref:Uncharacterized protein n=1 Tax=Nelumbo nucifera TaxID=4432 RepID=A0A822XV91_NELNU|nr:TPA_asm: hypothetical protein HUJ06_024472 [Nelumbo nucifera]